MSFVNGHFDGFRGNTHAIAAINTMIDSGRIPHSLLIYGNAGTGRKTLAAQLALVLTGGKNAFAHPDILWAERSGKLGGYSVETARKICVDAYVKPNNGDKKVFIFPDADNVDPRTQNTLLKIIEEPPDCSYFIFTAVEKSMFLPTVISRATCIGLAECTPDECEDELKKRGFADCGKAVALFGGNIGLCVEYLEGGEIASTADTLEKLCNAVAGGNEYDFLRDITAFKGDKRAMRVLLRLLAENIRGAAELRADENAAVPKISRIFAERLSLRKIMKIYNVVNDYFLLTDTNVGGQLAVSAFCADLFAE